MTNSSSGHSFTADGLSKTWTSDCFVNIQKRRETVTYKSSSSTANLNLAYVQSQEVISTENLSVRDRSTILPENRTSSRLTDQILESVNGFNIETEQFLVTDVFTPQVGNVPALPLFYQHVVSYELGTSQSFADIRILDSNFQQVSLVELQIDSTEGIVYNNLVNSFDSVSGESELYYVSYLVKDTSNPDATILSRYTELVSNGPIFREAVLSDLDEFGNFLPDRKVYLIQEDIGASFSVVLPSVTDYGVRRLAEQRLRVLSPPPSGPDDPWFVSVQNSKFISAVDTSVSTTAIYKYRIAEFASQTFTPFYPYKLTTETSTRVSRRIIKTIQNRIVQDAAEGLYVDVVVSDENETPKFALTSDPLRVGEAATSTLNFANVLLGDSTIAGVSLDDSSTPIAGSSIDGLYGFIILPAGFEIEENDIVQVAYYYEEEEYEFSFLDLNPLANSDVLNQRVVIFCRPEPLGSALTQSLFYLIVNEDGIVIDSNYNAEGVEGSLVSSLGPGEDVQDLITNERLWYDRPAVMASGVSQDPQWAEDDSIDFVKEYTVQGDPNINGLLVLGEIYVREAVRPGSLNINDIRIRGGGISNDDRATVEEIQPEAIWHWDVGMWDGYPYPGAASYFVEVPADILEACGGRFSAGSVRGIVNRHTALGVYPVIHKYNNYEPIITEVEMTVSGAHIEWTQHPEDAVFDLYTSNFQVGPWDLTVTGMQNNPAGNQVFLEIPAGVNKYILVTGRKDVDGPVCFSGPIDVEDPGTNVPATTISGVAP